MITNPNTLGLFDPQIADDHRAAARAGRPGLPRRRQHERHPRHHPAGRLRRRHDALQRPQDVHRPARRRRPRRRPHRGAQAAGPVPAGAAGRRKDGDAYRLDYDRPKSIGRVRSFFGNVGILLRGYCYIRTLGPDGLREVSENAVLNANYLLSLAQGRLRGAARRPLHARVRRQRPQPAARANASAPWTSPSGCSISAIHAPTVYFPLVVPEALMIEPTETESKETLDAFADALLQIQRRRPGVPARRPRTRWRSAGPTRSRRPRSRSCGGKPGERCPSAAVSQSPTARTTWPPTRRCSKPRPAGGASLRFYGWSEPTLSLGYFQPQSIRFADPLPARLAVGAPADRRRGAGPSSRIDLRSGPAGRPAVADARRIVAGADARDPCRSPGGARPPPRKASLRNRNTAKSSASCTTRRATCASVRPRWPAAPGAGSAGAAPARRRPAGRQPVHPGPGGRRRTVRPAARRRSARGCDRRLLHAPHRLGHGPRRLDRRRTPSHRRPGGGEVFASRLERQTLIRDNGRWKKIKPRGVRRTPRGRGVETIESIEGGRLRHAAVRGRPERGAERANRATRRLSLPASCRSRGRRSGAAVGPRTDSCCPFRSSAPRAGPPRKAPGLGLRRLVGRLDRPPGGSGLAGSPSFGAPMCSARSRSGHGDADGDADGRAAATARGAAGVAPQPQSSRWKRALSRSSKDGLAAAAALRGGAAARRGRLGAAATAIGRLPAPLALEAGEEPFAAAARRCSFAAAAALIAGEAAAQPGEQPFALAATAAAARSCRNRCSRRSRRIRRSRCRGLSLDRGGDRRGSNGFVGRLVGRLVGRRLTGGRRPWAARAAERRRIAHETRRGDEQKRYIHE